MSDQLTIEKTPELPLDVWERALDDGTLTKEYDVKEILFRLIRAVRRQQSSEYRDNSE